MKLSEMKRVLAESDIQLTKSLGQNFLHDANQLRRIVELAELKPTDRVLEIGPGLGPLTELLLQQAGEVLAIEKDARLVEVLRRRFEAEGLESAGLHLVHDDALEYLRREQRDWRGWKLVANLPYSVASPLLVQLAQGERGPERMVVTLQIEVAKRLLAQAGTPDYGVLTLLVQLDYEPRGSFKIPATCFHPQPDVDSACVCLVRRGQPLLAPGRRDLFARLVKRSFSQRRKMMLKVLKEAWPAKELEAGFDKASLPGSIRAEAVSLEQFVRLTEQLVL